MIICDFPLCYVSATQDGYGYGLLYGMNGSHEYGFDLQWII